MLIYMILNGNILLKESDGRKVEGNSSPSTHNVLMYSAVEGVEGKTEEILFDEVSVILCIIQFLVW